MKKAAILSITALYLAITSGMFVCLVHCAAETLSARPEMQMGSMGCKDAKACKDCCQKHANYIIKENIKPGDAIQFVQFAISIPQTQLADFLLNKPTFSNTPWEDSNAPPGRSGRAIIILHRSILV